MSPAHLTVNDPASSGAPVISDAPTDLFRVHDLSVTDVDLIGRGEDGDETEPAIAVRLVGTTADGVESVRDAVLGLEEARLLAVSLALCTEQATRRVPA